jgi:hypothetical protein
MTYENEYEKALQLSRPIGTRTGEVVGIDGSRAQMQVNEQKGYGGTPSNPRYVFASGVKDRDFVKHLTAIAKDPLNKDAYVQLADYVKTNNHPELAEFILSNLGESAPFRHTGMGINSAFLDTHNLPKNLKQEDCEGYCCGKYNCTPYDNLVAASKMIHHGYNRQFIDFMPYHGVGAGVDKKVFDKNAFIPTSASSHLFLNYSDNPNGDKIKKSLETLLG